MLQVVVQAPTPLPPLPPMPFWMTLSPGIVVVIVFALVAGGVAVLLPLMKAFAARIAGGGRMDPAIAEELDQLRGRLADVESLQGRIAELEERVDFAERLLAQKRQPEQLER